MSIDISSLTPRNERCPRYRLLRGVILLLLSGLLLLLSACADPTPTESFIPAYVRFRLCGGAAQIKQIDSSEWTPMGEQINIQGATDLTAGAEGAQICIGDGSRLELEPGATLRLEELHPLPRLQITVQEGEIRFETDRRSYEFILPGCVLGMVRVPVSMRIEVRATSAHLMVEEGTVKGNVEIGGLRELRLFAECEEVYLSAGEEPEVSEYCEVAATDAVTDTGTVTPTLEMTAQTATSTATSTPTRTPTPTHTPTQTATPSPTPRPVIVSTATPTPVPPTATSPPPPPGGGGGGGGGDDNEPTQPPPTQPPPTEPPPPTSTEPPPQPTDPPPRPTPTPGS